MYIRSEKRTWKILGKHLPKGAVMPITAEQLKDYRSLLSSGDLVVLDKHPEEKKKTASRRRARASSKQQDLKGAKTSSKSKSKAKSTKTDG